MTKYLLSLSVTVLLFFSLNSCVKNGSAPGPISYTAFFITQASPNAPLTDLYINGGIALQNVPYGLDSGYSFGLPGTYEIKFNSASSSNSLVSQSFNLKADTYQSIFAIDSVSKMKLVSVEDHFGAKPTDSVEVRYFDFSPDAPYHYAKFVNTADSLEFITGRSFNDQASVGSYADFETIKSGTYNLELTLPGSSTPFKTISNIELKGGKAYTIYLKGFYSGTGTQALDYGIIQHLL